MDELNNKQMILLTMFTSFVVSIASGIITVAMLEEAPPTLTQTVNRVVERTIERVVSGTSTPERTIVQPVTTVTKEVTVYAKEDDLVIAAVEKNQSRMVHIYFPDSATTSEPDALGFVISRDGFIVAETKSLLGEGGLFEKYKIRIGSKEYAAKPAKAGEAPYRVITFLQVSDLPKGEVFDAVSFGRGGEAKLAQTVVLLGGNDGTAVMKSTLSRVHTVKEGGVSTTSMETITGFDTLPKIPDQHVGALVTNLDGQAVGIVVRDEEGKYLVYPASRIFELVGTLSATTPEKAQPVTAVEMLKNTAAVGAQ